MHKVKPKKSGVLTDWCLAPCWIWIFIWWLVLFVLVDDGVFVFDNFVGCELLYAVNIVLFCMYLPQLEPSRISVYSIFATLWRKESRGSQKNTDVARIKLHWDCQILRRSILGRRSSHFSSTKVGRSRPHFYFKHECSLSCSLSLIPAGVPLELCLDRT